MILLLWFGVCAALLAAGGVDCVITETMAARAHEIAIKTALGSPRVRLARESVSGTLVFVLAGESIGALVVRSLGKVGSQFLYGVSVRDPFVLLSVTAFLFIVPWRSFLAGLVRLRARSKGCASGKLRRCFPGSSQIRCR